MEKERNDSFSEETTVEERKKPGFRRNQAEMTRNRRDGLKKRVQGRQCEQY